MENQDELPTRLPNVESHENHHHHLLSGWRFRAMIITIILTVLGYLLFTLWGGWRQVVEACYQVGIIGIGAALLLSLCNYGLRFLRWQSFLYVLGYYVPWLQSLRIYIAGFALTTTPGKAGEALRSIFLKDYGIPYRQSFGAFFAERLSDLIAVLILASVGLWEHSEAWPIVAAVAAVIIFCLVAVQIDTFLKAIENFAKRMLTNKLGHVIEFVIETVLAFRCCYRPGVLVYGTILGVLAWGAEGVAFYYLLKLLGSDITLAVALFIYAFSMLIGAITFLPGGLGGAEVTMVQLLILYKMQPSDAVAVTLVIRLATLWFSVVLGLWALPKSSIDVR